MMVLGIGKAVLGILGLLTLMQVVSHIVDFDFRSVVDLNIIALRLQNCDWQHSLLRLFQNVIGNSPLHILLRPLNGLLVPRPTRYIAGYFKRHNDTPAQAA